MGIILIIAIILLLVSSLVRCIVFNIHNITRYSIYDIAQYIIHKKWKDFNEYGIDMYVGMFGHGKTLSMTHRARVLYKRFGNTIQFVSNYKLYGIPYVPLVNFNQLVDLGEEKPEFYSDEEVNGGKIPDWYYDDNNEIKEEYLQFFTISDSGEPLRIDAEEIQGFEPIYTCVKRWKYQGTVVLIDEIEDVLSHRNYANFPLQLLNMLTQQRKKRVYIMCSAQRFFMVDKLWRAITTHVIDCNKYWRLQGMKFYDAWDYENAMNTQLVKPLRSKWWFVKNKDFACYSTEQMISKTMSEDFLSNEEQMQRLGLDNVVNEQAIKKPSRKLRRDRKSKK